MYGQEHADHPLRDLWRRLKGRRLERRAARAWEQERALSRAEAVEEVVSGTEPKLRALGGYDRELGPAVERTLAYIADLIDRLPPPVELSRAAWQRDPHINAFFATAADLPPFLGRARALQEFFKRQPGLNQAFAIMTSTREEKQVFGISLQDNRVRRDVAQTSIGFVEPRLLGPAATEAEVREEAKRCALQIFIGLAREQVANSQGQRERLERERQIREVQLRSLHAHAQDATEQAELPARIAAVELALAENARALAALGGPRVRLEDVLAQVRDAFATPEDQLRLAPAALRVDRLGIKQENHSSAPAHELSLLECTTASSRLVVTLIRCPRAEMPVQDQTVEWRAPYLDLQWGKRGA